MSEQDNLIVKYASALTEAGKEISDLQAKLEATRKEQECALIWKRKYQNLDELYAVSQDALFLAKNERDRLQAQVSELTGKTEELEAQVAMLRGALEKIFDNLDFSRREVKLPLNFESALHDAYGIFKSSPTAGERVKGLVEAMEAIKEEADLASVYSTFIVIRDIAEKALAAYRGGNDGY